MKSKWTPESVCWLIAGLSVVAFAVWIGTGVSVDLRDVGPVVEAQELPLPGAGVFGTSYYQIANATLASATTLSTAVTVPTAARYVHIQVEGQNVRWRNDDTAPTAAVGNLIYAGGELTYPLQEGDIQLIRCASGATVNVWFEKGP